MKVRVLQLAGLGAAVVGICVVANAAVIAEWNFEQGIAPWQTIDPQAQLTAAAGTGQAAEGSFSLHIAYPRPATAQGLANRGPMVGAFGTQIAEPLTRDARCLEFSIRASTLTLLVVALDENDGSSYNRPLLVLPGKWHHVKMYLDEFSLSDDSQDENAQLDPEQIQRLGFLDAYGFLMTLASQTKDEQFQVPGLPGGDNEIWVDAVKFTDEKAPAVVAVENAQGSVPKFAAILGAKMQIDKTAQGPKDKPAWVLKYALTGRQLGLMVWPVRPKLFAGSPGLHLLISATNPTALLVQVKEKDGAKYNYLLQLDPGADTDQVLAWPDFSLDEESIDANGKLDPDQIIEVTLVDGTLLIGGAAQHQNQLSIALIEPAK